MVLSSSQRCSVQRRVCTASLPAEGRAVRVRRGAFSTDGASAASAPVAAVAAVATSVADRRNWRRSTLRPVMVVSFSFERSHTLSDRRGFRVALPRVGLRGRSARTSLLVPILEPMRNSGYIYLTEKTGPVDSPVHQAAVTRVRGKP